MPESLVPVSAHLDFAIDYSEVLWFLTGVCKMPNLDAGGRNGRQPGILGAHLMYLEPASRNISLTGMQLWARLMPPVAATPAQPRKLKLLPKIKKPSVSCLPLSESDRQIEVCSFELTNTTQKSRVHHSRTHAMMQTIDYRFELSTVHVADNQ